MAIEIDYYITMVSKIMSLVNAEKSVRRKFLFPYRPRKGMAEGGCGGNSAIPLQKIEASPAALLVESRTQQKSFLFLLEEKIRRAQNQKCRENFFAGWRVPASGGGLASLVWFRSAVFDKMSSSQTVKTHQNLTFFNLTDFLVGGAKRRPLILWGECNAFRRALARLSARQDEVRLPCDFNSVSDLLCPIIL